jgi:hypothetical protein
MIAASLAGMELLGGLMSAQPFNRFQGRDHFQACWRLVYPNHQQLAEPVYELARHGLAHQFLAKPLICVYKIGARQDHLKRDAAGDLVLDALVLAEDLERVYNSEIKQKLSSSNLADVNLREMIRQFAEQAHKHMPTIESLPPADQGRLFFRPGDRATGSAFQVNSPSVSGGTFLTKTPVRTGKA